MNIFEFKPVGQGLYYTGTILGDFNFVYDCGTSGSMDNLRNQINKSFFLSESKEIDFVVISHLHEDHFSGLPDLCESFNVNKVYLPYLGDNKELIKLILANAVFTEEQDISNLYQIHQNDKYRLYSFMCCLYKIDIENNNLDFIIPENIVYLGKPSGHQKNIKYSRIKDSQEEVSIFDELEECPYWYFRFINKSLSKKRFESAYNCFKDKFHRFYQQNVFDECGFDRFLLSQVQTKEGLENLRGIYEQIFNENLNLSSTVLLHYPKISSYKTRIKELYKHYYFGYDYFINGNITLLTGDSEFDRTMHKGISKCVRIKKFGGVMQVPHHGAYSNWKKIKPLSSAFKAFVIPAGKNNYGHPHELVLNEIGRKGSVRIASESSSVIYLIE